MPRTSEFQRVAGYFVMPELRAGSAGGEHVVKRRALTELARERGLAVRP